MQSFKHHAQRAGLPEDRPAYYAFVSALVYVVIATAYIMLSSVMAATYASSLEQLLVIETVKGVAFVFTTGALFYAIAVGFWRKMRHQRDLLVQSERKAVASMYSATLAHDLNNLLMGLSGLLDALGEHERGDEGLQHLSQSLEHAVQRLAPFAKRLAVSVKSLPADDVADVDLASVLSQSVDIVRKHPDVRVCTLEMGTIPSVNLRANGELLEQALSNLVINAAQAAGQAGKIRIEARLAERAAVIEVHDSGPGIPPEKAELVFDPGYTTKMFGTGLGLLTVQACAASCGGRVEIARSPLGGALFRLVIPLCQARAEAGDGDKR